MGAYLEFQELILDLLEQNELEAYTVHDYIDSEQLGRRWDLVCRHGRYPAGNKEIVTTVSVRLNSPLEVLLEEASALEWEPGEDVNLDPDADGEVEVEVRLPGELAVGEATQLRDILHEEVAASGVFDQFSLVQEERLSDQGDTAETVLRLRLTAYPEPQDFGRDAFWAALLRTLAATMDLLYRQFPAAEAEPSADQPRWSD